MRMRRRAWTDPVLDACPFFIEEPSGHIGHWPELFDKKRPVMLEIGCGKGVSTAKMAHDNPDANFIAIDEVRHVLAVSVKSIRAAYGGQAPGNIVLSAVDALRIHDTFSADDGIERIYISFPNPWDERAKHHKRRLTHPRQLVQYRAFLKRDGEIWFKTDNDALFLASRRYLAECGFEITYLTDDLHASGFEPNYVSEHEQLYAGQGKNIHFLIARMADLPEAQAMYQRRTEDTHVPQTTPVPAPSRRPVHTDPDLGAVAVPDADSGDLLGPDAGRDGGAAGA